MLEAVFKSIGRYFKLFPYKSCYAFVSAIGIIIRYLIFTHFLSSGEFFIAVLISVIIEPLLHKMSFAIVGVFYKKGSAPTLGSVAYTVTYSALCISSSFLTLLLF